MHGCGINGTSESESTQYMETQLELMLNASWYIWNSKDIKHLKYFQNEGFRFTFENSQVYYVSIYRIELINQKIQCICEFLSI